MPISTGHQKVQTNMMKGYKRPPQYIYHHCQLGHVTPGLGLLVSVCVLMLPMLGLVDEHVQLTTMYCINSSNQWYVHQCHMTFSHTPMVLPSLSSILPAMILQNRTVKLDVRCSSCTLSQSGVCHVSPVRLNLPSGLARRAVLTLLLLLSGDIETNPGPVLSVGDLDVLMRELYDVRAIWQSIGVQLRVSVGTLKAIEKQYSDPIDCLRETLIARLKSLPPSKWGDVVNALRTLGDTRLAEDLEHKYCPSLTSYLTTTPLLEASNATPVLLDPPSETTHTTPQRPSPSATAMTVSPQYTEQQHPSSSLISDYPTPSPDPEMPSTTQLATVPTPPHNPPQENTVSPDEQSVAAAANQFTIPTNPHHPAQEHMVPLDKESVKKHVKELQKRFQDLVISTYRMLRHNHVDVDLRGFRSSLLALPVFEKREHQQFINDHLMKIKPATTFDDLWAKLNYYWNFLNFDLLQHIVSIFASKDLKQKMESYEHDLQSFRNATRVCDFISCWPVKGQTPPKRKLRRFVAKMNHDWDNCTLEDLETLKGVITRKFFLPNFAIQLRKIKRGCIAITWLIPAPFVKDLQKAVRTACSEFFKEERIITITIDGKEWYPTPPRKPVDYQQDTTQSMAEPQQSEKPDKIHSDISKQETLEETHQMTLTEEPPSDVSTSMLPSKIQLGTLTKTSPTKQPPKHQRKQLASEMYAKKKCVDEIPWQVKLLPSPEQYLSKAELEADPSLPTKYKDYLSSTAAIRAALYTTFNAKMAAEVFTWSQHNKLLPPTTMTQLLTAFTLKTVVNHTSTHPVHHKQITTISDLPPKVCEQLQDLCRMAYEGILNEQQLVFPVPIDFSPLSLMKIIPQRYSEGRAASYYFINLTLQEYLAAIHISRFPLHDQTILIQQHLGSDHFKMTIRFLAGLTKLEGIPRENVMKSDDTKLTYSHLLFEGKETTRTLDLYEMVIKSHYTWTPLDYYVTGHAISRSNCPWRLNFGSSFIDDEKFQLFCQGCAAPGATGCRGHILQANFNNNEITSKSIQSFINIQVEELLLSGNPIGNGNVVKVINALCGSGVKKLGLDNTGIGLLDCEGLCELLKSSHSLQYLLVGKNNLSSESVTSIITGLSHNRSLTELDISNSHFKMENVTNLASMLTECTLTSLMLKDCHISGPSAAALLKNTTLRILDLDHNPIGDVSTLATKLEENKTLTQLWLKDCHISSEGAVELAAALRKNSTLKDLDLDHNPIGVEGASLMSDMLQHNTSLEHLWLCDNSVGKEGVHKLINSLKHNHTLRNLRLPKKYKIETSDQRISWR